MKINHIICLLTPKDWWAIQMDGSHSFSLWSGEDGQASCHISGRLNHQQYTYLMIGLACTWFASFPWMFPRLCASWGNWLTIRYQKSVKKKKKKKKEHPKGRLADWNHLSFRLTQPRCLKSKKVIHNLYSSLPLCDRKRYLNGLCLVFLLS